MTRRSADGVQRRLSAGEARDFLAREARHREARLVCRRTQVREKDDVGKGKQAGVNRWFPLIHVETRAQKMLRTKGRDEGLFIDDGPARGVDEDRSLRKP